MFNKKSTKHSYSRKSLNNSIQLVRLAQKYGSTKTGYYLFKTNFFFKPDINEKFIDACENGDLKTVNYILQNIKEFNIEVTDNLGRTALRLAVENEHLEVDFIAFHLTYVFQFYLFFKQYKYLDNVDSVLLK